jgi:hypothetical protein
LEKNLDHIIHLLIKGKSGPKGRERLVLHYFLITLATTAQSRLTLVSTKLTEFSAASGGGGGDSQTRVEFGVISVHPSLLFLTSMGFDYLFLG